MARTWVIVADSSRAHIYAADKPLMPLHELEMIDYPSARLHERELISDKSGRAFESVGSTRHAFESNTSPKEQEAIKFARELSSRIEAGRNKGEFAKLILVAPPAFLGTLRKYLSTETSKLVTREVDKNLTHHSAETVREHLPERI